MADPRETDEEARARVEQVRATQIFGDTPTDSTIGDVVVPAHDEEAANASVAAVDAAAEDGNDEAADLAPGEAKRQFEQFDASDESVADADGDGEPDATDDDSADGELDREEKIRRIEAANSAEEVDALAAGDERVTVKRAAEKKRSSWG